MILYDFFCPSCKHEEERVVSFDERLNQICTCGGGMKLNFTTKDSAYERKRFPYYDESLDKTFSSNQEKKSYLKQKNLVQIDGHFSNKKRVSKLYFTK